MSDNPVTFSVSTWQQPVPSTTSPGRQMVVGSVADLVVHHPGRVRLAVDGFTAAGKTTFGHELALELARRERPVFRASLDDFKRAWSEAHLYDRTSGEGYYRNAQDLDSIRSLLLVPAASTGTGLVALCSIDPITQIDHSASTVVIPDDGVLIVDGVFALRPELNDHWDLRVWIDVDPATSLARGVERDTEMEGSADAAEALHRDRYHVAETIYLHEVNLRAMADIVIDNTDFDRPRLVRSPPA